MNRTPHDEMMSYKPRQISPATILLVEDEASVRQVTCQALELGGYRVLAADGPIAATHIARDESNAIDLLLTDVIMPGMNGPELAQLVRELRPELVTLFMTGYAESEVLRRAMLGGPHQHIQKPFTVHGLLARVADALAARWNDHQRSQVPQCPSP
jgi:CheY-like chemotaxis protein